MEKTVKKYKEMIFPLIVVVSSVMIFAVGLRDFLLFHQIEETFTIVISFGIFIIAWSSRRYIDNAVLFIIGVAYFFIGGLDFIHMLSFEGKDIGIKYDVNIASQFWIAARYLETFSIIGAILFLAGGNRKRIAFVINNYYKIFFAYAAIFLAFFLAIFYLEIFPEVHIEGEGMAPFRIYSEYIISSLFIVSIILLFKKREKFDPEMANLLSLTLIMKLLTEITFTQYLRPNEFFYMLGHIFRFISFLLMYKAFFEIGLSKPYGFLFSNLKKSEERYRALVEFSPDPIVVHRKGKVLYANGLAKTFFGFKEDRDVVGAEVLDFFHPKYREQIRGRMKKLTVGEWRETPRVEMEAIRHDGAVIPVEVKGMGIMYDGKEAIESIIRDISERREAEKRIRSLAQFPEESPNPIIRSSGDGQIEYTNQPARKMLHCFDWKESGLLPEPLMSAVKKVVEKNERPEFELACRNDCVYYINLAPSLTDNHVNIYGRDITKRKLAEKKLAEAQAELQRRTENQLIESYRHMGMVNRKISLLLDIEKSLGDKKNKQEVSDYIVNSAISLAGAKVGMLYVSLATNHLSLVSSSGIDEEKKSRISIVSRERLSFINKMFAEKRRVNSPIEFERSGTFDGSINISYFVALPILKDNRCKGFLFLGFQNRKSMDVQELEFLDVFSRHISNALADSGIVA